MDNITTQEKRRQARERELEADMAVAAELMGGLGNDDGRSPRLSYPPHLHEYLLTLSLSTRP
jgi:hypothetical protein